MFCWFANMCVHVHRIFQAQFIKRLDPNKNLDIDGSF